METALGTEYDISASGSGLRTLVSLASAIELSDSQILLFDEPDAHLHSSVQRQIATLLQDAAGDDRQILISTHSPELIDEFPIESIVWIDKNKNSGSTCDDIGKVMVSLGAISRNSAAQYPNCKSFLFFEGKPDKNIIPLLIDKCGFSDIVKYSAIDKLNGSGDADKLKQVSVIIQKSLNQNISVAAILDTDYLCTEPSNDLTQDGCVFVARLPCKELENLLLTKSENIYTVIKDIAEHRGRETGDNPSYPPHEQIDEKIDAYSKAEDIKKSVKFLWQIAWSEENNKDLNNENHLGESEREFNVCWENDLWRRRCCSGKLVLKKLSQWIQQDYKISFSINKLFHHYDPSDELKHLFEELDKHIKQHIA